MSDAQDTTAPAQPISTAFIPPPPPPPLIPPPPTEAAPKEATPDLVLERGSGDDPFVPSDGGDAVPPAPDQAPPSLTDAPTPAPIEPADVAPPDPPSFVPSPQPPIIALGQVQVQAAIALAEDPLTKLQAFLAANPDVVTYIQENPPPDPPPATS